MLATRPVRVIHVRPDTADRGISRDLRDAADVTVVEVATVEAVRDRLAGAHCVVCEYDLDDATGLDVLRAVREDHPSLPVFLWTADPDAAVASRATRLDVTEYCYGEGFPTAEAVRDRVDATVGEDDGGDATTAERVPDIDGNDDPVGHYLRRFSALIDDPERPFEAVLSDLLDLGRDRLGVAYGSVTRIEGDTQRVVTAVGDHPELVEGKTVPLTVADCRHTAENGVVAGTATDSSDDPFDFGCYLGGELVVDGDTYGRLWFADDGADEFDGDARAFVAVLVRWLGTELERRRYARELETTDERLETVLERVDHAVVATDPDWRLTYVNEGAADLFDVDPEAVQRTVLWEAVPEVVDDLGSCFAVAMETGSPRTVVTDTVPGATWTEVTAYPSPDGLLAYLRDVTERKERERTLTDLLSVTQRLMAAGTKREVARVATEATETVLGLTLSAIRLYDPETDEFAVAALSETAERTLGDRPAYDVGEGLPGRAFAAGETIYYPDVTTVDDGYDREPIRSALYLPLGEYGVLTAADAEPNAFSEADRDVAELLAANVTSALARADRQETLERYETILETAQDPVYALDDRGRFVYATDSFADLVGYDREALIGADAGLVLTESGRAEGEALVRSLIDAADADDGTDSERPSDTYRPTVVTADGTSIPVEVEIALLPGDPFRGSVGVVRDRRPVERARRRLQVENERFEYLFEHIPDPVTECQFVDGEPILRSVNPAFESVFGYDADEVVGTPVNDLIVPEDGLETARDIDERSRHEDVVTAEVRRETATGIRHFLFSGVSYTHDGSRMGYGVYTDISRQKERERRLKVLQTVLRHNLRTELNVVSGYLDELAGTLDDEGRLALLGRIRESVDALSNVGSKARAIESAVDYRSTTDCEPVDVTDYVRTVAVEARAEYPDATVAVEAPDAATALADDRLALALENLVENAVEHACEAPTITIEVSDAPGEDWLAVTVHDDGPGIPAYERELVTGERPITKLDHGSGLGLWTVAWVVEALGGRLWFENPEDGAAVTVLLRRP